MTGGSRSWVGRVLSGLAVLFFLFDAVTKIARVSASVAGTTALGFPEASVVTIGVLLLACTVLYVVPRTSVLGAILLTGYLGGAVAAQLRVGNPLLSHVLFPVYLGVIVWAGLVLRTPTVRALLLGGGSAAR
ncbi:MAG TPA: DoxX family protein [Anaeromyxobacter sp.]|nr:DoxX family protein [Anaeromyxobacter sp.]